MKTKRRATKSGMLKRHLLREMSAHRIPIGQQLPTENQLMQQFSLSRGTVQRVLAELSAEGHVERRQGSGTFRIAPARGRKSSERTMLVGVWFNSPTGPMYGPVAEGIRKELARWGYHAVFENGGLEPEAERRGIEYLVRKRLDGFIVAPSTDPHDDHGPLAALIDEGIPIVLVDRLLPGHDSDLVATHSELGAEQVIEHLIRLGHRRIGFIGIPGISTVEERRQGYQLAMACHGLAIDEAWLRMAESTLVDCGRQAAREILALPPDRRPTALFGANDIIAQTLAVIVQEHGLRVPEDLSIAGFDDLNMGPDYPVWLTTYSQPKERIGQQAARLLMRRIQEPSRRVATVILEGELVERSSTAPPGEGRRQGRGVSVPAGVSMNPGGAVAGSGI